jgi:hypothetical protein
MQGPKTHEQHKRILERKDDVPSSNRPDATRQADAIASSAKVVRREGRQSEFPVSSRGMNQESDHNKHNRQTEQRHKAPKPEPAQQKQD